MYVIYSIRPTLSSESRPASIEPELKFDKVADRIALFEGFQCKGYDTRVSNAINDLCPGKMALQDNDQTYSATPPPRPPPPLEYVQDKSVSFPNYLSLPRNSRILPTCAKDDSAAIHDMKTSNVMKSSSLSNVPKISQLKCQDQLFSRMDNRNKILNSLPSFDKYITPSHVKQDQQKVAGRIIG